MSHFELIFFFSFWCMVILPGFKSPFHRNWGLCHYFDGKLVWYSYIELNRKKKDFRGVRPPYRVLSSSWRWKFWGWFASAFRKSVKTFKNMKKWESRSRFITRTPKAAWTRPKTFKNAQRQEIDWSNFISTGPILKSTPLRFFFGKKKCRRKGGE
jgi:hypothetical protein